MEPFLEMVKGISKICERGVEMELKDAKSVSIDVLLFKKDV